MLKFFIYFIDFHLKKSYKTQNNRKFKPKNVEKSIKIFTSLIFVRNFQKKIFLFIFKKMITKFLSIQYPKNVIFF